LNDLRVRINRYEGFTKKFMEVMPDELYEVGNLMHEKQMQNWAKEDQQDIKQLGRMHAEMKPVG